MSRSELREQALERAGYRCEFPGCTYLSPLEMAHIDGLGMGGSKHGDRLSNVAMLCKEHHDWLDCRITPNMRRFENAEILRYALHRGKP